MKALQIYFKVPVDVRKDEGGFVASCFLLESQHAAPNKHEALVALTDAVQTFMTSCCDRRVVDDVLRQHDLRLSDAGEAVVTGHYIDVAIQLKIPALI